MSTSTELSPGVGEQTAIEDASFRQSFQESAHIVVNDLRIGVEMAQHAVKKAVPKLLGGLAFAAISATGGLIGAEKSSTDIQFAPHDSKALVTTDGYITGDLGLPGAIRKKIEDSPAGLGARIVVKEIPITEDRLTNPEAATELNTESFLESREFSDLKQYLTLFGDPELLSEETKETLINHYLKWTAITAAVLATGVTLFGKDVRKAFCSSSNLNLKTFYKLSAIGVLALPLVPEQSPKPEFDGWVKVSSKYNGTPLEGLEVKGEFLRVLINKYGVQAAERLEEVDEFYKTVQANLEQAAQQTPLLGSREEDKQYTNIISISDVHCNPFTGRVVRQATKLSNADVGYANGDLGMSASPYEKMCYDILRDLPDDTALALANHDYEKVGTLLRSMDNLTISDGTIHNVGGIPTLGYPDPRKSVFGQGTVNRSPETIDEIADKLALTACASNVKPVLQVPLRAMATRAVEQGCADVVFAGDTHNQKIKVISRPANMPALEFTVGTTSGAGKNQPTIGLPEKEMSWIHAQFKEQDGQHVITAYQEVTVDHKSGAVTIGKIIQVP